MKYGVKLINYDGQYFDMWVFDGDKRFESSDFLEAEKILIDWGTRNPKGVYSIEEIKE